MKKTIYYLSGTHWDREWYITFQEFRMKLVGVVDDLLDLLEQDPEFGVFHFDGQTIVLEDYLEIRPENRSRLEKQIQEKRILIGPWYCMPDEFLVSGESLIRNFILGQNICRQFGTEPWKVGYVPDIFGHIAQFPQILNGAGMTDAMLTRGVSNDTPTYFRWKAPSGDEVLTYRFPAEDGYGSFCLHATGRLTSGTNRPADSDEFRESARAYLTRELNRTNAPMVVAADAMDHEPAHRQAAAYIAQIRAMFPDCEVRQVDLREMFEALEPYRASLPVKEGELIQTSEIGIMPLIAHTLSSRISVKQRNSRCETLLEKRIEPVLVFGESRGITFPPAFRRQAWKHLLQNHPHDSICGCSRDTVHQDMQYRFSQTETIGQAILIEARDRLVGERHIIGEKGGCINLFNPLPYRRRETVEAVIPFRRDFPKYQEPFGYEGIPRFRLYALDGQEIRYTIKSIETNRTFLMYGEAHTRVDMVTLAFETELEPLGFTALTLKTDEKPVRFFGEPLYSDGRLENAFIQVTPNPDGTICLLDKAAGRQYDRLLGLWDDAEIGDGWNSVRPAGASLTASGRLKSVEVLSNTAEYAEIRLHREYPVPRELLYTDQGFRRSEESVDLEVKVTLSLSRESRMLRVRLDLNNQAADHRLRLLLPTGCRNGTYTVNQSFAFVARAEGREPHTAAWGEPDQLEKNMRGIALERDGDGRGLAFIGQHGFYECAADKGTLFITLLRGFRRVYYDDRLTDSQELGRHSFTFILAPLSPDTTGDVLQRTQDALQAGVFTVPSRESLAGSLLETRGAICVSAVKPAEDDSGDIILRLYNPGSAVQEAEICAALPVETAAYCDMLETAGETCPITGGNRISLTLSPFRVQTVRLRLAKN